jgi:hypothetical protein
LVLQARSSPVEPRSPPSTQLLETQQHASAGPSPWRHPLQVPLYLDAPPCSIFSLCSRPLAAMALASAPCAACSARQGWRSSAEPLPSMGQRLLPRHLPLEQQPWQLRALSAPCFAQSSGQHHPLPPLRLKHAQPYTAQLLAAEFSPQPRNVGDSLVFDEMPE